MVPLGSVATLENDTGPVRVVRFNLFPAAEVQGVAAPGVSSGEALKAMEQYASQLPPGFSYEWTELALQEKSTGDTGSIVFLMAVVLVFLVLAAQYEAFTLPLAVILIVPMCILAAIIGVNIRGMDNNILTQVGLVVLVALAAKNAILIVEFAKQAEDREGLEPFRGGGRGGAHAPASDPDDVVRLHLRRRAADAGDRTGRGDAPGAGHRGVLRACSA
jgi:multidrug efflux pump subunit AcrB